MSEHAPSTDLWLREAKADPGAAECGMYLFHNGIVRRTSRAEAREGKPGEAPVSGMLFDYDDAAVEAAVADARRMPGIRYVRVWLNRGELAPGDNIMLVLVGGDIRPRVIDALQTLVGNIKTHCVTERETFAAHSDASGENDPLSRFELRPIRPEEAGQAADIEAICFPPHEACSREMMLRRAAVAPELFLVAVDRETGRIAGFLNGLATDEKAFRDEFFRDAGLHAPAGSTIMLLGLDVLPEYRRRGLARKIVETYCRRERGRGRRRLVLTCLAEKVEMYERMGFRDLGVSASSWGGESWHEMDFCLAPVERE